MIKNTSKNLTQSLAALIIVGLIAYSILDISEAILGDLVEIGLILTKTSIDTYYYLQFVPQVVFIFIWAYIVFRLLNNFHGELSLSLSNYRKPAIEIALLALGLYILHVFLSFQVTKFNYLYLEKPLILDNDAKRLIPSILAILGLIKMTIIIIGFFRVFRKSTAANNAK